MACNFSFLIGRNKFIEFITASLCIQVVLAFGFGSECLASYIEFGMGTGAEVGRDTILFCLNVHKCFVYIVNICTILEGICYKSNNSCTTVAFSRMLVWVWVRVFGQLY